MAFDMVIVSYELKRKWMWLQKLLLLVKNFAFEEETKYILLPYSRTK
jgi:hypothetical protein